MRPLLTTALPKCGIQRKYPRKILYGTNSTQGQGLRDPLVTQLVDHLHSIMRHHHRDTPTCDNIQGAMEEVQTYVGSSVPFWELPFHSYGRLAEEGWMKHTWQHLDETKLTLKGPPIVLPPQHTHDAHLMDLLDIDNTSAEDIDSIQNMRFHLGVTRVSDIVTANGREIENQYWDENAPRHPRILHAKWRYPKSRKPKPNEWTLWQGFLRKALLYELSARKTLRQPLKQWNTNILQDTDWIWWYDSVSHSLWQRLPDQQWKVWEAPSLRCQRFVANRTVPSTAGFSPVRCSVLPGPNSVQLVYKDVHPQPISPAPPALTIPDQLQALHPDAHWSIKCCQMFGSMESLVAAFRNGTAIAVSDGSLKSLLGTSGYIITTPDGSAYIQGVNRVPGPLKDGDSYRCELAGLYAILQLDMPLPLPTTSRMVAAS